MSQAPNIFNLDAHVKELEELLSFRFVDGSIYFTPQFGYVHGALIDKSPLSTMLLHVLQHHNAGEVEFRQYGLCRLVSLVGDLQVIKRGHPDLLRFFRSKFSESNYNSYWGLRFEIDIAAHLIRMNVPFQKGEFLPGGDAENADFAVAQVSLECTSLHIDEPRPGGFLQKLQKAIHLKSKKTYSKGSAVLFVDITNLTHHRLNNGQSGDDTEWRTTCQQALVTSKLGAIVLSQYLVNKDGLEFIYQNTLVREDGPNISNELKEFLDRQLHLDVRQAPIRKYKPIGAY